MMSLETLSAMLDEEIDRAIDRIRQARRELKEDIAALEEERRRRAERRSKRA
jgi:hypothetical protein